MITGEYQYPKPALLVSVRCASEAQTALVLDVDWIDLKDPNAGPLGCPCLSEVQQVAKVLDQFPRRSVALGELRDLDFSCAQQIASLFPVVKVGLAGCHGNGVDWPSRLQLLQQLVTSRVQVVPVLYADFQNCAAPNPEEVLNYLRGRECRWLLIDTYTKNGLSLLDYLNVGELKAIQSQAAELGVVTVFAGSLKLDSLSALLPIQPQVIAVRGAVCEGDRRGTLSGEKVRCWQTELARSVDGPPRLARYARHGA